LISDYVTPRQLELLALAANGLTPLQTADLLKIKKKSVWESLQVARKRSGMTSNEQLIARLVLEGSFVIDDKGDFVVKSP
jgi:DNA-binding CsgD family transcriptional regulator